MKIKTVYFGEITVEEKDKLSFQEGLPGFPDEISFCLLEAENTPFRFLQSLINEHLCFILIRIFDFFPEYECELPENVVNKLEIESPKEVDLLAVVRLQDEKEHSTANLLAPIAINVRKSKAQQFILQDRKYSIQTPLVKEKGC